MIKDETGNKYGRLTVIKRGENDSQGNARWYCKCDCGNPELFLARGYGLRNGRISSCGCKRDEARVKTGKANKKYNTYDLTGEYGIGYTLKGEEFYFDLEDYELIKNYCWYIGNNGYVQNKADNKLTLLHRLVMNAPDGMLVDHIYHNKIDNRKSELRLCSSSENNMNKSVSHSSSGVCGVYWLSNNQKWSAEIQVNHKKINLGLYEDRNEAIKVRKAAEEKYFKDFAYKER